jgi:spermidine synthase
MVRIYVYVAVIVVGASVSAMEMLGTRIIAPFCGSGLYLWSALISVTLAALSVGYVVGGRWADRGRNWSRFCGVIGVAGLWTAAIPWLRLPVLVVAEKAGLRAAVLIAATVLFFPPLAFLGMVSPYAIRLQAPSLDVVGRTAGNLYALATVAGVVAAVMTGYLLIPNVGVYRLVFLVGFVLIAIALWGLAIERKRRAVLPAVMLLAAGAALVVRAAPAHTADPDHGLLALEQSAYGEVRVVDSDDLRCLIIDGSMRAMANPDTWQSSLPYVNVIDIAKGFFAEPGGMLLVGLGGASIAKSFHRDGWRVDAVEIDPAVTRVAHKYFGLDPAEARVYGTDPRRFLLTRDQTYDLVVMDAGGGALPFHLVTTEALGLIRSHLAPGGVLALNVEAVGWDDPIIRSLAATAEQQFAHVLVLPIAEPPSCVGNLVLLASNSRLDLDEEPPVPRDRFSPAYDRAHAWDNRFEADVTGSRVLTDDRNPIGVWSERVNLAARRELHASFAKHGVAW